MLLSEGLREALDRKAREESERRPLGTTAQVSRYLGVPIATLHAWRSKGKGPRAIRVGKYLRWDWADVDAWLAAQEGGGSAA